MSAPAETTTAVTGAGRIGDEGLTPRTDPRTDPALARVLAEFEMDAVEVLSDPGSDRADVAVEVAALSHSLTEEFYATVELAREDDVSSQTTVEMTSIRVGERDVRIAIHRPVDGHGPLPAIVYLHGGAMTFASTFNPVHDRWCTDLAESGAVVIQVDFRNAWTEEGLNPYPAALDDCVGATRWTISHLRELGASGVIVEGESGGGNLALAVALRARAEGWADDLSGIYAKAGFISGRYADDETWRRTALPSLIANDGYAGMDAYGMDAMVALYDPTGEHRDNPLAWPYTASTDDVVGLPPHVIDVDELDPLIDENLHYARQLATVNVQTVTHIQAGMTHCADWTFRAQLPSHHRALVARVVAFAQHAVPTSSQS